MAMSLQRLSSLPSRHSATMAAAVVVTSPAGAASPECPIILLATDPVVVNTSFLDWLPVAAAAGGARGGVVGERVGPK